MEKVCIPLHLHLELFTKPPLPSLPSVFSVPANSCYPKRDKESITNECPMFPLFAGNLVIPRRRRHGTMGNDNMSAKNKRASHVITRKHGCMYDTIHGERIPAELQVDKNIAKTPMCVTGRDACRRFFIYLSRRYTRTSIRIG